MKLYFLRHGETLINRQGNRFQGQINTAESALSEIGRAQALEAGRELAGLGFCFDRIWSSPQERAMQTAMLATGVEETELVLDDRLKEMNFGPYEGRLWETMDRRKFYSLMTDFEHYMPEPGMEGALSFVQRVSDFLEEMKRERPAGNILVSTHGGTIRAMLVHLHELSLDHFWTHPVGNCAWFELTLEGDRYLLTAFDDKAERDLNVR